MTSASELITAVALGNPSKLWGLGPRKQSKDGLLMDYFSLNSDGISEATTGSTTFVYGADDERYDTGSFITVYYSKNAAEADCVENEILSVEDSIDLMTFRDKVLPSIDDLLPVIRVNLKTINGSVIISPNELSWDSPDDKIYPPISDTLNNVPRVSISLLRKCDVQTSHFHVDLVTIAGGSDDSWYAFKRYRIPLDDEHRPMSILLAEVEHLNGFESPYIIKPAFLVTDDSNTLFRGYLTPFMPAGTLADVFDDLVLTDAITDAMDPEPDLVRVPLDPKVSHSSSPEAQFNREVIRGKHYVPKLSWPLKHTWSIEATSGVVALHDKGTYTGDIKLDNILLCRDGHLQHIDVAPQEGYTECYMPPEFDEVFAQEPFSGEFPITEARDVFALGIVLWQIAEEAGGIDREMPASPSLVWAEGQESTPQWYRDLVDSCLETEPDKRPTARQILDVLKAKQ